MFCGGIIGFARKGSTTSLAGGVGTGLLLFLASYLTLSAFHKRKNSWFGLILETGMFLICALKVFDEMLQLVFWLI